MIAHADVDLLREPADRPLTSLVPTMMHASRES
jgi:hypothetical protein